MNPALKAFYDNEVQREVVKAFLLDYFKTVAIERVMKRESTESLADAHDVINKAFIRLNELFVEKPTPSVQSSR